MVIIIGTGLAGYQLAREFRKIDQTTPLQLVTADDGRFYPKPQLSTALTQKKTAEMLTTATAESMAAQLNAEIITHSAVIDIQPAEKKIILKDRVLSYQKLVLACGADVIKIPMKGNAGQDIFSVNHIYHYAEFEKHIHQKKHITILGSGLIGCEFANDLTNAGYEVHIIAPDAFPLQRFLPEKIGKILQEALTQNGVRFHLSKTAEEINKLSDHYEVRLSQGEILKTDFVLSAIGLKPHIELAKNAGIKTQYGVVVNRYLETSIQNIYALGDCAEVEGHVLPFITPILTCARGLAQTLAGTRTAVQYPAMPIVVKTPAHPVVICPPAPGASGQWQIDTQGDDTRALLVGNEGELLGFVLTNGAVKERMELAKRVLPLF